MNTFLQRLKELKDIFVKPGPTLARLMEEREYRASIGVVFLSAVLLSYVTMPLAMEKAAEMSGGAGGQISVGFTFVVLAAVFAVFMSLVIGGFMIYLFFGAAGAKGEYGHFFALVVNASLIDTAIPNVLQAISLATGAGIVKYTSLAGYIGGFAEKSLPQLAFSQLNVFSIWYIVAVALGVSVFANMSVKKSMVVGSLYFLFKLVVVTMFKHLVNLMGKSMGM